MRVREIIVFVLYLAGAVVFTYPLARDIRTATTDLSDPLLDAWALAWVAHQLPRDPVHLFDANRFYPEKGTLAYTDPMIGIGVPLSPIQWIFGEALVTLNVAMLLSIAISGYGAYRLGWCVSGSRAAGAVAGSVFAFAAYRLNHLEHVQLQTAGYIPLLYLCLRRFLEEGRLRHGVGIAVFLWLVSASCAYYGMFTWVLLGVAIPYEIWRTRALQQTRRLVGLGLALTLSGLAFVPLALPFMRMGESFGLERPLQRLQRASARPTDYLRSGSHLHRAVGLKPPSPERTLFPGILALGLSAVAIARSNRSTGLFLLVGGVAFWASLGPAWGLYRWLHAIVPGLSGVRVPPRISIYVLFAVAIVAAQGAAIVLSGLQARWPAKWLATIVATILILVPLVESFGGPIPYARAPERPAVYRWLAEQEGPVPVVEMPLPPPKRQRDNAVYLYWSTAHFKPLANGYATVVPPVYAKIAESMKRFPSASGVALLRDLGFRYVILHRDRYLRARAARIEEAMSAEPGLSRIYRTENETVFELTP
jgi:hypothetical protein